MAPRRRYLASLAVAGLAVLGAAAVAVAAPALTPAAARPSHVATSLTTSSKNGAAPTAPAAPTATTVSGSPNPASFTGSATGANVLFTANVSVTDGSGLTVNEGSVTFADGANILGTSPVSGGHATLLASLAEGTHQIVASFTDGGGVFVASSGNFDQRVNHATSSSGVVLGAGPYTYCNTGTITVPTPDFTSGAASPYPSNIFVTNLPGTVRELTVTLNGFTTNDQGDLLSLLVGPGGNNFDFFSLTGTNVPNPPSPLNITFADTASSRLRQDSTGNLVSSGTFLPTSFNLTIPYPQCPPNATNCANPPVGPPLPSNPFTPDNKAATAGTSILGNANAAGVFGGTSSSTYNGNGTWSLYMDDGGPTGQNALTTVNGGWCLNLTENLPSISVTKSHGGTFTQGEPSVPFTISVTNIGPGATGDPTGGNNPLTVTDTLNPAFTFAGFSGTGWNCAAVAQTVTCTNDSAVAQGATYAPLAINVNVSPTATPGATIANSATASGGGAGNTASNTDTVTILPGPTLAVLKSHTGTVTQGQTAQWNIAVSNTTANSMTFGTITMVDLMPPGYTLASFSSTAGAWTCSSVTFTVTCTTTEGLAGGATSTINLTINVPSFSPVSVTNTADVFGGGDLVHNSLDKGATSSDTATVVQSQPRATVVSYNVLFGSESFNLIGSARNRLPWEITGIRVVFSQPIATANVNSLTGVTATGFSGLGTNTLTWSVAPIPIGAFSTTLLATGPNAIKDANGNVLNGGTSFAQNFKVLWADFNDDGVVSASDSTLVNAARSAPFNIFADLNGDGVVNATDVNIVRTRIGTSQP